MTPGPPDGSRSPLAASGSGALAVLGWGDRGTGVLVVFTFHSFKFKFRWPRPARRPIPDSPEAESVRISPSGVWAGDMQFREVAGSVNKRPILRFFVCLFVLFCFCCLLPSWPSLVFSFLRESRRALVSGGPARLSQGVTSLLSLSA